MSTKGTRRPALLPREDFLLTGCSGSAFRLVLGSHGRNDCLTKIPELSFGVSFYSFFFCPLIIDVGAKQCTWL